MDDNALLPALIPANVLIIRYKTTPHTWSMLVMIGDTTVEGEIRAGTRRMLEQQYDVEVAAFQQAETFEVLKLIPKQ